MKSNALIFDLDDTLISTRQRNFQIVKDFLKLYNLPCLFSYEEYLSVRKEQGFTNLELLKNFYNKELIEDEFKLFWQNNIESLAYLSYDESIVDINLLEKISSSNDLYILSLRSNHNNSKQQVRTYPFYSLFNNVCFLYHNIDINPKISELLKLKQQYINVIFIGDSELDKQAAIKASVDFVLVQTGIYQINNLSFFADVNMYLKEF